MNGIKIIVCDLDGTLCDVRHRQHLAQGGEWDEFHALLSKDAPRPVVLSFIQGMAWDEGKTVIFLTGRPEPHRAATVKWLADVAGMYEHDDYHSLLMRGKDQYGSDTVVKQGLLEQWLRDCFDAQTYGDMTLQDIKEKVLILDDRDKVVAHFRDLGYECWQVNEGAF